MANLVTASKDKPGHIATKTAKVNEKVCVHLFTDIVVAVAVAGFLLLLLIAVIVAVTPAAAVMLLLPLFCYCHMLCIYGIMHCRCIMCSVMLCCIVAILGSCGHFILTLTTFCLKLMVIFSFFVFCFCFVCLFVLTKWSNPNSSSSSFNVSKPIFLFHNALVHKATSILLEEVFFLDGTP